MDPENPLDPKAIVYPMMLPSDDPSKTPEQLYCYWDSKIN